MGGARRRAVNLPEAGSLPSVVCWAAQYDDDMVPHLIRFSGLKAELRRHTRGPTTDAVRAMYASIEGDSPSARRDRAILRTIYSLGLRRSELLSLVLADVDLQGGTTDVLAKGKNERSRLR